MFRVILIISICLTPLLGLSQTFQLSDNSTILIKGSSTMHDWESPLEKYSGNITVALQEGKITAIESLDLSMEVESIESGKKKMDKLTYEAFDSEANPNITFKLKEVKKLSGNEAIVIGDLTMAGSTQQVEIAGTCTYENDAVKVTASHTLNMEQFGMERPTAMLGAIKVGAEDTIDFDLNFN